jgi:pyruvate dehydrogenase E2 component (dihydrolipoamide acetyltransferase)
VEIKLPFLARELTEATVTFWFVWKGGRVEKGDDLVEVTTSKAAFTVPSPINGLVLSIVAEEGQTVRAGEVLVIIEEEKSLVYS